jgi:SAM-dependent methyltransferase
MRFILRRIQAWVFSYFEKSAVQSFERRKKYVQSFISGLPEGSSLIDVGAGTQQYRKYASHLNYVPQDFAKYDGLGDGGINQSIGWDISKIEIVSDILEIPVEDCSFDYALCTDVLEHVPRAYDACNELRRIVKVGGKICITVPTQCDAHQTPYFFSGGYTHYFFQEVFKNDLVEITFESAYFETVDQKIYLGLVNLYQLILNGRKFKYIFPFVMYLVFAAPLILTLRFLPEAFGETGNNGLLITITKSPANFGEK